MRKQLLGVFLPLLVLALLAAAAETQNTGTPKRAALQGLAITHGEDGISVEISAEEHVNPKLSTLDRPARVVLDLPATVAAVEQRSYVVDADGVKGVRIGMDGQTPPNTRVVVDLVKACAYELVPGSNNRLILKLHPGATTTNSGAKPAASRHHSTPPVAAKAVASNSSVPNTAATAQPSPVPAPAIDKQPAPTAAATGFVFVEPSYKPKDETNAAENQQAVIAPPARALEAAAKFADKPA